MLEEKKAGAKKQNSESGIQDSAKPEAPVAPATESRIPNPESSVKGDIHAEVVVLGAGPGGYTAAFRAADLGKQVVLIEKHASLGGVCLNVGCIPSKALLHVSKVISEADEVSHHGVTFGKPKIDIDQIRNWKESVIGKLTGGLEQLAKARKVEVVRGRGELGDRLIGVGDLDRAPAVHILPGPGLGGHQGSHKEHSLAVFEREPCLHPGTGGTRGLDDDAALADAPGTPRSRPPASTCTWPMSGWSASTGVRQR